MRKIKALSIGFFIILASGRSVSFALSDNFSSFSSAFGSSSSASYGNVTNMGAPAAGDSTSTNFRSYTGFLPSQSKVIDFNITFLDEIPSSSDRQPTASVTPKITVQISGGNTVSQVKYRISNSGSADANFNSWRTDATVDTVIDATKTRYRISIPNASGDSFAEGENNYIQWQTINNAGANAQSGIYHILVSTNDAPTVTITQPDVKSDYMSMTPHIAATITDEFGGVDTTAIQIKIDDAAGTNVATFKSSVKPSMYDTASKELAYRYDGAALVADAKYTLTVSAVDKLGKAGSASATFIPKGGSIADLIPYPSPFDPKVQPAVIRYVLDKRSDVWINIYDMSGRIIKTVVEAQSRGPGLCEDPWNGENYGGEELANGVYFCEVVAKNEDGEFKRYSSLAIFGK